MKRKIPATAHNDWGLSALFSWVKKGLVFERNGKRVRCSPRVVSGLRNWW